jgi:uncharacterized protein (TIGR02145 family)
MRKFLFPLLYILLFTSCKKSETNSTNPGNTTPNIKICNQVWMLKNLDVGHYRNGDTIPQVTDPSLWDNLATGAWCYYDNDPANGTVYGKLYNWYAVYDPRSIAPNGWHVPSNDEWTMLSDCLGGQDGAGFKMKETGTTHWVGPNTGATNSSGFTGLPGGARGGIGPFSLIGINGIWWSSVDGSTGNAWVRGLYYIGGYLISGTYSNLQNGFSVRCVKD